MERSWPFLLEFERNCAFACLEYSALLRKAARVDGPMGLPSLSLNNGEAMSAMSYAQILTFTTGLPRCPVWSQMLRLVRLH